MDEKQKVVLSSISLALVAFAWGTSYAIIKDTLTLITPFFLMTLRFGLSTILLGLIYSKKLIHVKKEDLKRGSIIGIFMFFSFFTLVTGIQYTTASKQSFLVGSYVLIVPFLAWLINRKKPDRYALSGAVLATIGLALLTLGGGDRFGLGDFISLFCALSFAFHMITIERYSKDSDPIILTIIQFVVTTLIFIVLTGIFESYEFSSLSSAKISVAYLVIVTTVIAFVVQNVAQRYISSTSTALILTLESACGSVFAVLYLKETMTWIMILGCFIVLIGIITQETKWKFLKRRSNKVDLSD